MAVTDTGAHASPQGGAAPAAAEPEPSGAGDRPGRRPEVARATARSLVPWATLRLRRTAGLDPEDWQARHPLVVTVRAAHVPVLAVMALLRDAWRWALVLAVSEIATNAVDDAPDGAEVRIIGALTTAAG